MDRRIKKKTPHWPAYARALKREAGRRAEEAEKDFNPLIEKAQGIEDPYYRAQALGWIGRMMADAGVDSPWVFSKAVEAARKVQQEWRRAEILIQVVSEMSKTRIGEFGVLIDAIDAIHDPRHRRKALEVARRRMARAGIDFPKIPAKVSRNKRRPPEEVPPIPKGNKITFGLLNTYRGKTLQDAHIRAAARAAPLCYAYGLNLCLFGFPLADAEEAISRIEKESMVGEGRSYIRRLFDEGRLFVLEAPKEAVLSGMGEIVATTSRPDPKKRVHLDKIAKKRRPFCVLMGLGSRGLPKGLLRLSMHHLELTGKDIPLETCTAMGVLAARLSSDVVKIYFKKST
jgi:hypothetical protein